MMFAMRLMAAAIFSVIVVGCAGTTANAPSATQATTNAAIACTAPAQALVELTEGPDYKANPPQNATLRTACAFAAEDGPQSWTVRAGGVADPPHPLTDSVVAKPGQPIANARLDFW